MVHTKLIPDNATYLIIEKVALVYDIKSCLNPLYIIWGKGDLRVTYGVDQSDVQQ